MAEAVPVQASAGMDAAIMATMAPAGAVLTNEPILGEASKPAATEAQKPAFFPANPAFPDELAKNKPVKELSKEGSGGGIFRSISGVITDLRTKHEDKKRARAQAAEEGAPSQAKFRKELAETPVNSPVEKQPSSPLKSFFSLGSPKRSGSGAADGDKVRSACFSPGTSSQVSRERKPSLAQRYSAWKADQKQRKGSANKSGAAASTDASVPVSSNAAKAETPAVTGDNSAAKTPAEPVVVSSDATPAETAEVAAEAPVQGKCA